MVIHYFSDYQCPHCRDFEQGGGLQRLRERLLENGRAKLVRREFPVLGEDSVLAAQASRHVWQRAPDAYWEWHEGMMRMQDPDERWLTVDRIVEHSARYEGIEAGEMRAALEEERHLPAVRDDVDEARHRGVRGTPSMAVGDAVVPAGDTDRLERAVDAARR